MNDRQRRLYERGQREVAYVEAQADDFPPGSKGGQLAVGLKGLLAQAAGLDAARVSGARKRRQGTEGREQLRAELRQMLSTAFDTAKTVALDQPSLKGLFSPVGKNNNDQALIAAANSFAQAAAPYSALFAEYGLPATFFNDMSGKAAALEASVALQNAGSGASADANATLEETFRQADEVADRLDTVVRNRYRDDPAKLAAWEIASRVERAPRRKPGDGNNNAPPPANA